MSSSSRELQLLLSTITQTATLYCRRGTNMCLRYVRHFEKVVRETPKPIAVVAVGAVAGCAAIATVLLVRGRVPTHDKDSAYVDDTLFDAAPPQPKASLASPHALFEQFCREITSKITAIQGLVAVAETEANELLTATDVPCADRAFKKRILEADERITQVMVQIDSFPIDQDQTVKPANSDDVEQELQRRRGVRRAMLQTCWDLHHRLEQATSATMK